MRIRSICHRPPFFSFLKFESSAFAANSHVAEHTDPGAYHKDLALWLAEQLRVQGLPAGDIIVEDFGWCVIPLETKPHRLYVVCTSTDEEHDGWQVFAFVEAGYMGRLLGKDISAESLASLFVVVRQVLQSASLVKNLREEEA